MSLNYENLDNQTRSKMIDELNMDHTANALYISSRLNSSGASEWFNLLTEAIVNQNDKWLANEINRRNLLKIHDEKNRKVPANAHQTLAEGEFNRFYMRGLCLVAIEINIPHVVAYRARYSKNPRLESEAILGKTYIPKDLLADLRTSIGIETALKLPPGPNSGISIQLP